LSDADGVKPVHKCYRF